MKKIFCIAVIVLSFVILCYGQTAADTAKAEIINSKGERIGNATLVETPHGVLIKVKLTKIPAGIHAFHIHEVGSCEPPSFTSAGGHFNPFGKQHGIMNPKGLHAGDLPNIHVGSDGRLAFEVLANQVTLARGQNSLFDKDGSALVVHEKADDYKTDPAGEAGSRIACGVVTK
ncbi:MAG: superoxide dismutase family protein [Nitrospirota bacterium]